MTQKQAKSSYLIGTFILTGANIISQFLGLFSKLAIMWLIGEEGVGIYNYPYAFYAILLSFSSVGFNVAVSKLVSQRISEGNHALALRFFRNSLKLMINLGLTASLILVILAWPLANFVLHDPRALYSYLALAPAALLNSWQAAYRGFFQGTQNMRPNALSQIVEQVCRITAMLGLAALLLPYGLAWGAAGATLGAAAGAIGSFLFLKLLFARAMRISPWKQVRQHRAASKQLSDRKIYAEILRYAIPLSFAGIGLPLFLLADSMLIVNRSLLAGQELTAATTAYGAYANNAMSLIALPTVLSGSMFVSLVPAISQAHTEGNYELILQQSRSAIKICLLLTLPAAAGMYLVAEPLSAMLDMGQMTVVALKALVFGMPFLVLQQVSAGILQGMGKSGEPLRNMFIGAALKAVLTWFLVPIYTLDGAAWATNIGFAFAALGNIYVMVKELGSAIDYDRAVLRPMAATALMALCLFLLQPYFKNLSAVLQLALAVSIGGGVYLLSILLLAALTEEDAQYLPFLRRPRDSSRRRFQ